MKKVFQIVAIGCIMLLSANSLTARQVGNVDCRSTAIDSLDDASTELAACQDGCPPYGNCSSFCESYYDLTVDNILAEYAVCMDGFYA